jgi:hypothetical protein
MVRFSHLAELSRQAKHATAPIISAMPIRRWRISTIDDACITASDQLLGWGLRNGIARMGFTEAGVKVTDTCVVQLDSVDERLLLQEP